MANRTWYFDGKEVVGADGAALKWDDHRFFTITYKGKKFNGEIIENASESNTLVVKINHRTFTVKKKGELDDLISAMGLDKPKVRKLKELAAPMPGRILQINVEIGQELQPGDAILSLEAMKMENILKAEGIGTVKSILVSSEQVVEKGAILIEFE
jgi:biotin carboxyl carrier protein